MPKKHTRKSAQAELDSKKFAAVVGALIMLVVVVVGLSAKTVSASVMYQTLATQTNEPEFMSESLVYLETIASSDKETLVQKPKSDIEKNKPSSNMFSLNLPAQCGVLGLTSAPHSQWVAVDVSCEDSASVYLINAKSGKNILAEFLSQESMFLGWANNHEAIIKIVSGKNAGIYLANASNGKVELLNIPLEAYNVSVSKNGKELVFVLTRGIGYGSEVWIIDSGGHYARQVLADPSHIIALPQFSPSGKQIAYIRMPDSNIPFTAGELWVMDTALFSPTLIGDADAGHGYAPAWSPDGKKIAYVVRENNNDKQADHFANRLSSNISIVDIDTNTILPVTNFSQTMVESPVWSEDGMSLAFNGIANGISAIWVYRVVDSNLVRITNEENALYPVWIATP